MRLLEGCSRSTSRAGESAVIALLLAVLLHECGHVAAAYCLGMRLEKIGISWRKLYVRISPGSPQREALVALAGPLVNLLLAAGSTGYFRRMNLILGLLNLLPLRGFDGWRVMQLKRHHRRSTATA